MARNILLFLALALCSLHAMGQKASLYAGSRIFWDARTPVKVFANGGYARIMQLQDGRLMACCENGGICIAFSSNQGATWTAARRIVNNVNNVPNCVPDMIQLSDGTLIVAYNPRPAAPYSDDRRFGIRLKRSTDNGTTWSDAIFVFDADCTFENGCWEPALLELPSGELQLYFADESPYTQNADQQISVSRSFDKGLTWSAPVCVSYRQGARDGMPVPVLLQDGKTIAVAIEDNGWGYGDFVPTIVRNTLSLNWRTPVSGNSSYRNKAVDYNTCPVALGGAPYLRVLPSGETVLSHQSPYNHGTQPNMYVYVGDKTARKFKAMSNPFYVPANQSALWNSLAVVDTGVVVAVSGIAGAVNMVKGYPKTQFEVTYGQPKVDGARTASEGYSTKQAEQVFMGTATGVFSSGDFAFDEDSLYIIHRVYKRSTVAEGEHADCVTFCLDAQASASTTPQTSSLRLDCSPLGSLRAYRGDGKSWVSSPLATAHVVGKRATSYYTVEVALPWSALGIRELKESGQLLFSVHVTNGDGVSHTTENMIDAKMDEPWTWMPLHVHVSEATSVPHVSAVSRQKGTLFNLSGQKVARASRGIFIKDGQKVAM